MARSRRRAGGYDTVHALRVRRPARALVLVSSSWAGFSRAFVHCAPPVPTLYMASTAFYHAAALLLVLLVDDCALGTRYANGADVIVYGATPAGIAAALSAASHGSVVLIDQQLHVGGMTSSGLGWDDVDCSYCPTESVIPNATTPSRSVYGQSIYSQFAAKVRTHYARVSAHALELSVNGTRHEPHVANQIFVFMLEQANVTVLTGWRLISASVQGQHVASVTVQPVESAGRPQTLAARVFVDGTYEGDLLATAGLRHNVGREGRVEYGELNAGVAIPCFLSIHLAFI